MAESLCCSPETITTLLISYAPIQKKKKKNMGKTKVTASVDQLLTAELDHVNTFT